LVQARNNVCLNLECEPLWVDVKDIMDEVNCDSRKGDLWLMIISDVSTHRNVKAFNSGALICTKPISAKLVFVQVFMNTHTSWLIAPNVVSMSCNMALGLTHLTFLHSMCIFMSSCFRI